MGFQLYINPRHESLSKWAAPADWDCWDMSVYPFFSLLLILIVRLTEVHRAVKSGRGSAPGGVIFHLSIRWPSRILAQLCHVWLCARRWIISSCDGSEIPKGTREDEVSFLMILSTALWEAHDGSWQSFRLPASHQTPWKSPVLYADFNIFQIKDMMHKTKEKKHKNLEIMCRVVCVGFLAEPLWPEAHAAGFALSKLKV